MRVIDTFHEIGKGNSYAAFSVTEVRNKTRASIVVNAGSTASFSFPTPVGLLQVGGKVVNRPDYRAKDAGIFCVTGDHVSILRLSSTNLPECFDAVQRGPFLSREFNASTERYRRTVAAVDGEGRLLILVTRESATLSALVSYLYTSSSALNIRSALNFDGDVSSGMILATDGKVETVGRVNGLIASAIAIYKKD